ncbi:MAG: class I SAM-dependent methyltransferase [Candidatus Helarchaeota archaeon]
MAKFKKLLIERLKNTLLDDELLLLPRGFQQLGDKAILTLRPELIDYKDQIAQEILTLFKRITGVYLKKGAITGDFRTPQIEFILGDDNPEIIHKEHGISYKFDITKIMFSKGNINERLRISQLVKPKEIIFDLFAGIGYFSLLAGYTGKPEKIFAFEINPIAYYYLNENIKLNQINRDRELIVPIFGDSNKMALNISRKADRVIMGILPAPRSHIETVFKVINKTAIVHYEGIVGGKITETDLFRDFEVINTNYNRNLNLTRVNYVKSYGPKLNHVTLDIFIS